MRTRTLPVNQPREVPIHNESLERLTRCRAAYRLAAIEGLRAHQTFWQKIRSEEDIRWGTVQRLLTKYAPDFLEDDREGSIEHSLSSKTHSAYSWAPKALTARSRNVPIARCGLKPALSQLAIRSKVSYLMPNHLMTTSRLFSGKWRAPRKRCDGRRRCDRWPARVPGACRPCGDAPAAGPAPPSAWPLLGTSRQPHHLRCGLRRARRSAESEPTYRRQATGRSHRPTVSHRSTAPGTLTQRSRSRG
jgi:hypothetical protein